MGGTCSMHKRDENAYAYVMVEVSNPVIMNNNRRLHKLPVGNYT
jgi:hypothetical protein